MRLYRKAVLIVHGFTGSLYDNEYLMNYLEYDREFDVYAKTLPGHDHDRFENSKINLGEVLNNLSINPLYLSKSRLSKKSFLFCLKLK